MNKVTFGTDGIRGTANRFPITADVALSLGQAVVSRMGKGEVIIAGDTRRSTSMLLHAVAAGVASCGGTALIVGVLPTPGVSYLVQKRGAVAGVVVSASHNPSSDNGIKLFNKFGEKPSDELQAAIEAALQEEIALPTGSEIGSVTEWSQGVDEYVDFLRSLLPGFRERPFSMVVDGANGAASPILSRVFSGKGLSLSIINNVPDGNNINRECGALHPEYMADVVRKTGADIGVSVDGDADRLILCDEQGTVLDGDVIMGMVARYLSERGLLAVDTVVATVMSNAGLEQFLRKTGITMLRSSVGDREVYRLMKQSGAVFGGENSGHLIFRNHLPTGDALLAAIMVVHLMLDEGKLLSELSEDISLFPAVSLKLPVADKPPLEQIPEVENAIRSVSESVAPGRVVVRYSGTEPVLRIMVEATSEIAAKNGAHHIFSVAKKVLL